MDWIPFADASRARYEEVHGEVDERALVRQGNNAYAAGLALLMVGDPAAPEWFRRAAASWRESWEAGRDPAAWGRPIGAIKAALLAGDEEAVRAYAQWALELGSASAESPIGRYAATLAFLALARWSEARHAAESLRGRDDFPADVADALAYVAAHDVLGYCEAVESVIESFESRKEFLAEAPVADTPLVLAILARRRDIEEPLRASPLLPSS